MRRWWLVGLVLVLVACGPEMSATPPPVTHERAAALVRRRATVADPLRIVVAGDSLAGEVKLPLEYALEASGRVDLRWELLPSLPRTRRAVRGWRAVLDQQDPEVIVMLIGYWETGILARAHGDDLGPEADWVRDRLRPFVDEATAGGAELLWIGSPLPQEPARAEQFAELARRLERFAEADPRVRFFAGDAGPHRWPDGLHLCPDGDVLVAQPVLTWIRRAWGLPVVADWRQGGWRHSLFSGDTDCAA